MDALGTDALYLLRLQMAWGADEALADAPLDRTSLAPVAPAPSRPEPVPHPPTLRPPAPAMPALPLPAVTTPATRAQAVAAAAESVAALRAALERFEDCPLRATATNLVFADGDPAAPLMLVGEAPGAEEDRAGRPFVGRSGQLLDRMLLSVGLDRTRLLITNLIYWRPPGNRPPTDAEVLTCLPFLHRHIALVRPRRLVLLGGLSTRALTGSSQGIRRMRGRWLEVAIPGLPERLPALPMLHPAYLLRNPGAKREAWADLLLLRRSLDTDGNVTSPAPVST